LKNEPDRPFVFIEAHPDSINDGFFVVNMSGSGPAARLVDFPEAYHYYGVNLGYADVFLRDLAAGTTMQLSVNFSGSGGATGVKLDAVTLAGETILSGGGLALIRRAHAVCPSVCSFALTPYWTAFSETMSAELSSISLPSSVLRYTFAPSRI
jgi:hypothetical protein